MRKIYNYLLLAVLLYSYSSLAQYVDNNWLEKIQFQDRFVNLKTTGSIDGSVYTAFVTNDLIRLGVKETDLKVTNGLYITKIGNEGEFKWVNYLEIFQESSCEVTSITNSADGALIYIAGNFYGQIDVNPDPQESNVISTKSWDYESFIVILEKDGGRFVDVYQFVPQDGGQTQTLQSVRINDIKVDSEGNLYGLGLFYGTVDFDPSASEGFLINPDMYEENIFAVKIDIRGRLVWAKRFAGDRRTYVNYLGLSVDVKGEVVVYGGFAYELNFLPDEKVILLSTNPIIVSRHTDSPLEFFFAKFNTDGEFMWAKHLPNKESVDPTINKLTTDTEQSIYFSGYFSGYGQIDVNPDPLEDVMLGADPGSHSGFVVKLDREGNFLWVNQIIAEINPPLFSDSYIADLDINEQGEVFFTGGFKGEIRFEDVNGEAITIASSGTGSGDAFVGKLNKEGKTAWMKAYNASTNSSGRHVSVFGNDYNLLGTFDGEVSIDKENGLSLSSSLQQSFFVISENETCSESYSVIRTYCGEPIVFGDLTITTSGSYTQDFESSVGCDSIVTLTVLPQITLSNSIITSPACFGGSDGQIRLVMAGGTGNYSYQWYNSLGQLMPNVTTASFFAAEAGNYEIRVSDAYCTEIIAVNVQAPDQLLAGEISGFDVTCADSANGRITFTTLPSGGKGDYFFTLFNVESGNTIGLPTNEMTFSGLKAGTYNVRVQSETCEAYTNEVVINTPLAIEIQNPIIIFNETCPNYEDGKMLLTIHNGVLPYTVALTKEGQTEEYTAEQNNIEIDGLLPGEYNVRITDREGCTISDPEVYTIESRTIGIDIEFSNRCLNSEIQLTANIDRMNPVAWYWDFGDGSDGVEEQSPIHTYTTPDTYSVGLTVDEEGVTCTVTIYEDIIIQAPLDLQIIDSSISCFGGSDGRLEVVVVNAHVGVNFAYLWSTGSQESTITGLFKGDYYVEVTDQSNSCTNRIEYTLTEPDQEDASFNYPQTAYCLGSANPIPLAVTPGGVYTTISQTLDLSSNGEINLGSSQLGTHTVVYTTNCGIQFAQKVAIVNEYQVQDTVTICRGEAYIFNNISYLADTSITHTFRLSVGCDSTVTLNLSVADPQQTELQESICEGTSYLFNGDFLSASGRYTANLRTQFGCDSVVLLNLEVQPSFTQTMEASICTGETYFFNGEEYAEEDIYIFNLTTVSGCDSIITLNLSVRGIVEMRDSTIGNTLTTIEYDLTSLLLDPLIDTEGYQIAIVKPANNGTIVQTNPWNIRYTANVGFIGNDTLEVEVCACDGVCSTAELIITVINSAPVITLISAVDPSNFDLINQQGQDLLVNLADSIFTFDINQNIERFEIPSMHTTRGVSIIKQNDEGRFLIKYSEMPELIGEDAFDFRVCDAFDECANGTFRIGIIPNNETPINNEIVAYNAVSPNGDGMHDYFHIEHITDYPANRVVIFNRWGEVIYDVENYDNETIKWEADSKSGNNKVPDGSYFYTIYLNPKSSNQTINKGYVYVKSDD